MTPSGRAGFQQNLRIDMRQTLSSIETEHARVFVDPVHGAVVQSFQIKSNNRWVDILWPHRSTDANDPTASACFVMVPWCNRLSAGGVMGQKGLHPMSANWHTTPYPVHGIGWLQPWKVSQIDGSMLDLRLSYRGADPYVFDAHLRISLRSQSLEMDLRVVNTGRATLPYGLGVHPFFPRTSTTTLRLEAHRWNGFDEMGLPQKRGPVPEGLSFAEPCLLEQTAFSAFYENPDRIEIGGQPGIDLIVVERTGCRHAQLWAPKGEPFFCVEPVSHAVDDFSFSSTAAQHFLVPGQGTTAKIVISAHTEP